VNTNSSNILQLLISNGCTAVVGTLRIGLLLQYRYQGICGIRLRPAFDTHTIGPMANENAMHRCITKFMLDTGRLSANGYDTEVRLLHFLPDFKDTEVFISGSSAEICIKPMLSCIGDIDIMLASCKLLAIPQGYTPPTELPDHYLDTVDMYEIIDSDQPGYVYLGRSCTLGKADTGRYVMVKEQNKNEENKIFFLRSMYSVDVDAQKFPAGGFKRYKLMNQDTLMCAAAKFAEFVETHGPAMNAKIGSCLTKLFKRTHRYISISAVDAVPCLHCLVWPPQASDWPARRRNHGWPDAATIDMVVSNGCDVVGAVHPLCKQDELMREGQHRLSFSRAEVTLLNSWTPVQQIVYHMLRFVVKQELLAKTDASDPDVPKLSNYHIKMLMLWQCEQKPQSWWSAESALIKLCSALLHTLSGWVTDRCCQHYFINDCNILDHFLNDASTLPIRNTLNSVADESVLSSWFVENYIRKCAERCPSEVSILFQDTSSNNKLEKAVQAVVDWQRNSMPEECHVEHHKSETVIQVLVLWRNDAAGILMYMKRLQNLDLRFLDYFVALTGLRVALNISIQSLTEELLEILWTLFDVSSSAVGEIDTAGGPLHIRRAIKLARLNNVDSNALEMLYNEMSKAYLHHSLAGGDESTYCVAHVLLAALCYKSGHYQAAVYHCEEVSNRREHHGARNIGAEFLPPIDDNVDSAFGLVLFYEHIQRQALNSRPETNPQAFITAKLLADYLYSQCTKEAQSKCDKLTKYRHNLSATKQLLLCDVLLFKALNIQLDKCSEVSDMNANVDNASPAPNSADTGLLVTVLELVALEKLISFRQAVVAELHSEQYPVLNEFDALHAYRCGLFEVCFEMCRKHVNMLIRARRSRHQRYVVIGVPQFVCLMDDELVSLFGIVGILHPNWVLLGLQFPDYSEISVLTLSLHLMVQCQKKLRKDSTARDTLQLVRYVHDNMFPADNQNFFDRLILKLTYRSLKLYIDNTSLNTSFSNDDPQTSLVKLFD